MWHPANEVSFISSRYGVGVRYETPTQIIWIKWLDVNDNVTSDQKWMFLLKIQSIARNWF